MRKFDIVIEGQEFSDLADFSIYDAAGGQMGTAITVSKAVTVIDGKATITLSPVPIMRRR